MTKTALVTGASSGIGEATALKLASQGIKTYAAARRLDRMEHLRQYGIIPIGLDVTDPNSITACIAQIQEDHGQIDILVNNAGYGSYGAVEDVSIDEARRQFDVNVFGLATLTQLVIPRMRQNRWGRIINISSVAGVRALPYGGWYHATKFAVEGLSSALRQELSPFGIKVSLIRPGAIQTEWSKIAADSLNETSGSGSYKKAVNALHTLFTSPKFRDKAAQPELVADAIIRAATAKYPRSIYTTPFSAKLMLIIIQLLGVNFLRDALVRVAIKLPRKM